MISSVLCSDQTTMVIVDGQKFTITRKDRRDYKAALATAEDTFCVFEVVCVIHIFAHKQ